jgi:integrase
MQAATIDFEPIISKADPVNQELLKRFSRTQRLTGLKDQTIATKLWRLITLIKFFDYRDITTLNKDDIETFYLHRREHQTPRTVWNDFTEYERFYKWLKPAEYQDMFSGLNLKRPKTTLPVDEVLSPGDISKLLEVCDNQRDRALVALMWDTGCRLGELIDLDVGRIEFDRYGGICILDGKTGRRRARLIDAVPDLQLWINMHPCASDPHAPLFIELRSGERRRLSNRRIHGILKHLQKKAGISKRVHPHGFRHGRATEKASVLTEAEMNLRFGWQPGSGMSRVYVHLSGRDLETKELQLAGLLQEDEIQKSPMEPVKCPRSGCKYMNSPGARFCMACGMMLSEEAVSLVEKTQTKVEETPEYRALLEVMKERVRQELKG